MWNLSLTDISKPHVTHTEGWGKFLSFNRLKISVSNAEGSGILLTE